MSSMIIGYCTVSVSVFEMQSRSVRHFKTYTYTVSKCYYGTAEQRAWTDSAKKMGHSVFRSEEKKEMQ